MVRIPQLKNIKKIKDDTKVRDKDTNKKIVDTKDILEELDNYNIVLPKDKKRKILAIILKENKGTVWKWISKRQYRFSIDENTYFNTYKAVYTSENNIAVSVYFEGIPIAMCHDFIETEKRKKDITLVDGHSQEIEYTAIKGVKVDSKVLDFLLNRGLADEFTKQKIGFGSLIQTMLTLIILICVIITTVKVFI